MADAPVRIAVVGAGYVGLVSGTCLAAKGHLVRVLDLRPEAVDSINRGVPTIHETGLPELLAEVVAAGRLSAAFASAEAFADAEAVLLCVGTPSRNGAIDLGQVEAASRMVGKWLARVSHPTSVIVKSTVVPGTTDTVVRNILEAESGKSLGTGGFGLGMNPEFLREGEAVGDFLHPDRIILGHDDAGSLALLERLYSPWACDKLAVNTRTAEMIKYANNCLLALQISAANELANVAAAVGGIDFMDVVEGVSLDKRWSPVGRDGVRTRPEILSYLIPGCGFGGSCFPKDVEAMRTLAGRSHVAPRVLQAVLDVNSEQPLAVIRPFVEALGGKLSGKTVLLLGLAFKPGTDDIRASASLRIARHLSSCGAKVFAHDPVAGANAAKLLGPEVIELVDDWKAVITQADGIIVATRWNDYAELAETAPLLTGKVLLDARRMFHADQFPGARLVAVGFVPVALDASVPADA